MQDASAVHAETPLVKLPLVSSAKRGAPSRVLVIYTGGTFGMVRDEHGVLKPAGLGLNDVFKKLPEFQHPVRVVWYLKVKRQNARVFQKSK